MPINRSIVLAVCLLLAIPAFRTGSDQHNVLIRKYEAVGQGTTGSAAPVLPLRYSAFSF